MILVRYHGSKNGRAHDTVAIQAGTAAASVREGRAVCLLTESIAEQITMYLLWGCGTAGHRADGTIETRTTRWSHDNEASRSPTAPHDPRFYLPAGCWRAQTTQHSQVTGSSQRRRAPAGHRSPDRDVALPPVYRRPPTLDHLTPRPRVRASSIVPWRALYGCFSATHPCISAAETPLEPTRHPATHRKHGLGQADGRLQGEHSRPHSTYLIGTTKNHHRGPLCRSGRDVPAQQLSRCAGVVATPAGGRPDDNLQATTQPNSRVRARCCIK